VAKVTSEFPEIPKDSSCVSGVVMELCQECKGAVHSYAQDGAPYCEAHGSDNMLSSGCWPVNYLQNFHQERSGVALRAV